MGSMWTREQEEELAELFERYQGDDGMYVVYMSIILA